MQSWSNLASLLPLTLMCYFPRNWDNLIICCSCAVCSMIGLLLIGLAKHWIIVIAGTSEITELRGPCLHPRQVFYFVPPVKGFAWQPGVSCLWQRMYRMKVSVTFTFSYFTWI